MKILLADDDLISRKLLQRTLERSGFEVVCVDDGASACQYLLAADGPRMGILDWVMPGKDGPSVCQEVRSHANHPYIYLILLTSREASQDIVMGLEAGADDYLVKPCNPEEMKARVRAGQRVLRLQDKLLHEASHDALTGLPNRSFFARRLSESVSKSKLRKDYRFAVLFIDIDRFKMINDSLGHPTGDELMKGVAQRLLTAVRTENRVRRGAIPCSAGEDSADVIARIGGDEFVILLDDIVDMQDGITIAQTIESALEPPFHIGQHEVSVTASIGISTNEEDAKDAAEILRRADAAMYKAKALGKARYEVSSPESSAAPAHLFKLGPDLRGAIENNQLELQYQPIVSLSDCRIVSFEALVRWNHPVHGLIGPADFISIAEETGLILPLGAWVLREACRQMHEWNSSFPSKEPIPISVNISPRQFEHGDLVASLKDVLQQTGFEARNLELELTEILPMKDADHAIEVLHDLTGLGVSLSLDDFGTGYSSLNYLSRFPVRAIKIDHSFIAEIEHNQKNSEIVQMIISLGHNLGMKVIAEGIENAAQMELLREFGCDLGQGFLFSHSIHAKMVPAMLMAGHRGESLVPDSSGCEQSPSLT